MMNLEVTTWNLAKDFVKPIRYEAFVKAQSIPEEEEWDELDAVAWHAVLTVDGVAVGTGRRDRSAGRRGRGVPSRPLPPRARRARPPRAGSARRPDVEPTAVPSARGGGRPRRGSCWPRAAPASPSPGPRCPCESDSRESRMN